MDIYGSGHWHVIRIGNATSRTNWIKPQGIIGAGWSCIEFFTDLYWPKMVVIWSQSYWIIIGWIPETIVHLVSSQLCHGRHLGIMPPDRPGNTYTNTRRGKKAPI